MNFILRINPKYRLQLGTIAMILAVISFFIISNYETGFFGGLLTGILTGLGIGLIVTYKKQ